MKISSKILITICTVFLLLIIFIVLFINSSTKNEISSNSFYNEGKIFTNLSKNFDFKIEKLEVIYDEKDNTHRLNYSILIHNKTQKDINNVKVTLKLDKKMSNYIRSGITTVSYEPVNLKINDRPTMGIGYLPGIFDSSIDNNEFNKIKNIICLEIKYNAKNETINLK
ncbi:hypothetical protein CLTEP_25800 [Clostridium tepidiprofundi DSM 19306]|uniref:Uncharacterized protein n=1 Tax=Clostridium tepidiprofundi DSM 19306 TaxID=1121338 RepID=A0A151ASG5_9CLOT|nr:hypothetical protein [Clostridium tepidiprofundi]KYH30555.1 hypothetical protein CLTEP_25800 [Clostridium tepidiprofundi DSM 19306]